MTIEEWREFCLGKLVGLVDGGQVTPHPNHVGIVTSVEWCCRNSDVRIMYRRANGTLDDDLCDADNSARSYRRVVVWGE